MRINLDPDHTEFVKQVAAVRADLNSRANASGQVKVSAAFMQVCYVPFLAALRSELRDEIVPDHIMQGVADAIAEIVTTTVQSMYDAPAAVQIEGCGTLIDASMRACVRIIETYERMIRDETAKQMPDNVLTIKAGGPTSPVKKRSFGVIKGDKK